MHGFLSSNPSVRTALSVAIFGLLASGAANAGGTAPTNTTTPISSQGYDWLTPETTKDTQNGYSGVLGVASTFTSINDSGTISGEFVYKTGVSTISGLTQSHYYGFEGTSLVNITNNTNGPLFTPGPANGYYGNNAVTGIANNGYATYSGQASSELSGAGSPIGFQATSISAPIPEPEQLSLLLLGLLPMLGFSRRQQKPALSA